jgi:phosphoribosylformimino-5-aminoimidazole carboxamide ribotide isomerase
MILFPAIDLKQGKCVRLFKGDMDKAKIYSDAPAVQAFEFESAGAKWIHIVDLDGAFAGDSVNGFSVKVILDTVKIPIQLGGGIRSIANIENWLEIGISRVILGTAAVHNPELVKEACKKFPEKIAVGIDAKGGKVAVSGWAEESEMEVIELAKRFEGAGVSAIIYTNIDKDGTLEGADIEGTRSLAKSVSIPVIASGGISNLKDLIKIKELEKDGVIGAISGTAIYEGTLPLKEALEYMAC